MLQMLGIHVINENINDDSLSSMFPDIGDTKGYIALLTSAILIFLSFMFFVPLM